jgi:hypothetical protein
LDLYRRAARANVRTEAPDRWWSSLSHDEIDEHVNSIERVHALDLLHEILDEIEAIDEDCSDTRAGRTVAADRARPDRTRRLRVGHHTPAFIRDNPVSNPYLDSDDADRPDIDYGHRPREHDTISFAGNPYPDAIGVDADRTERPMRAPSGYERARRRLHERLIETAGDERSRSSSPTYARRARARRDKNAPLYKDHDVGSSYRDSYSTTVGEAAFPSGGATSAPKGSSYGHKQKQKNVGFISPDMSDDDFSPDKQGSRPYSGGKRRNRADYDDQN